MDNDWIRFPWYYDEGCAPTGIDFKDWVIAFHGSKAQTMQIIFVNQGLREHQDDFIGAMMIFCHGTEIKASEADKQTGSRR